MDDVLFLKDEDIARKVEIFLSNKGRKVVGVGEEATPDFIADSQWVRQSIRADSITYEYEKDNILRFWTGADSTFEDTTLGGSFAINPRPQFTRYADTRALGISNATEKVRVDKKSISLGMGHYYHEALDSTQQTIHMIFGQAEFNSLSNYFVNYFNLDASRLANSGRWSDKIANFFKKGTTLFLGIVFWPVTIAMYGFSKIGDAWSFFMRKPASKYYFMRPNMYLYWSVVSDIVNRIATNSGLTKFSKKKNVFTQIAETGGSGGDPDKFVDEGYLAQLTHHFGTIFNESGYINVRRLASRAQRNMNAVDSQLNSKSVDDAGFQKFVKDLMRDRVRGDNGLSGMSLDAAKESFDLDQAKAFEQRFKSGSGNWDSNKVNGKTAPLEMTIQSTRKDEKSSPEQPGFFKDAWEVFNAEWRDGSAFATFRVDHTGSVSEQFSSSTGQTDLASSFNNTSASARGAKFTLAGGNLSDGFVGSVLGGMLKAAQGVIEGTLSYMGLDGILALGAAFADIPEYWQNSSASMPSMSYSMDLISPYGDPLSRMMNIYIPLAMILAAALPLSTGKQSYTSPFLCQVFDKGRAITRLGIVDSLQVTRGTSNLGFNKNKDFLAVNVTFSVKDLSSIMHVPVATGWSWDPLEGIFDEDNTFTDYIGVLSSLSLGKSHYLSEKIAIQTLTRWRQLQDSFNMDRLLMWTHSRTPLGLLDIVMKNTARF